ncbi:NADPH-dependent FMN reductase [Haloferax mucosum ATCC BAA-1512]|uniref:NADPH-dependent FMN reductase n=1 Tax=Haloferax mucosum ATCC BAA-1512 TaxID=662479 RepID=M0IC37_9EURY|nr:NAD(P)H-dependent oxidoreductase [Haloferax mucosum]ELZ92989.1 NADPH-dependent FMN reductase [Haloferax mucosum ATCC BAA-1512]
MVQPHIVALCGSLRDGSYTRLALKRALAGASEAGGTTELVDLREFDLPTLNPDHDGEGDAAELIRIIDEADAVILGTPVYHGSYSGVLKNALDYCGFDEFGDKTVGLLAVAGGSFPVTALEHLRSVCRALNAWVLPHQAAIPTVSSAFEDGSLADENLGKRVERLGRDAVVYANIEPEPPTFESGENVGADD